VDGPHAGAGSRLVPAPDDERRAAAAVLRGAVSADKGRLDLLRVAMLEDQGLVFVYVDAPEVSGVPRLLAITNPELFVVRFHGRSDSTWSDTSSSAAERYRYLYSARELDELARPLAEYVLKARESHLLVNNCYRDYSVRNASDLRDLIARYTVA
jgi:uncharacterized protein YecE (DUF72 family)